MREIVLDTETTGLDPLTGHRLIEIGCWELMNHLPTGEKFHRYINPERDVPAEAVAVHGLTPGAAGERAGVRGDGRRSCWPSSAPTRS